MEDRRAFPPPLWGRTKEGGRAALRDKSAAVRSIISSVRATPHPLPAPTSGAGALAALSYPDAAGLVRHPLFLSDFCLSYFPPPMQVSTFLGVQTSSPV
jgi:hypothetical protein